MDWLHIALLLLGGILAISGLIVAKKPDAKALLDKLVPFQAIIGIALLALGLVRLIQIGPIDIFRLLSVWPIIGFMTIGAVFGGIILGFLFGMPLIAKWMPGENAAEQKGIELSKKLAPYQVIIGLVCLASGLLMLLFALGVLHPM